MRGRRDALTVLVRSAPTADEEGRATRPPATEREVDGFVDEASARTREMGSQLGVTVEAVAQLPYNDPIERTDKLRVADGPLAGDWNVSYVMRGRVVTRALLTVHEV